VWRRCKSEFHAIAECLGMLLLRRPWCCTCSAMPALPLPGNSAESLCLPLCTDGGCHHDINMLHVQTVDVITAAATELEALPDHLLSDILRLVLAPLRAVNGGARADAAVRAWAALDGVSKR